MKTFDNFEPWVSMTNQAFKNPNIPWVEFWLVIETYGSKLSKYFYLFIAILCAKIYNVYSLKVTLLRPTSHKIFLHTILIQKDIFSSKYCSYISKSFQINRNKYFQFTQWKKYWWKNIVLSHYLLIAILCRKLLCVTWA